MASDRDTQYRPWPFRSGFLVATKHAGAALVGIPWTVRCHQEQPTNVSCGQRPLTSVLATLSSSGSRTTKCSGTNSPTSVESGARLQPARRVQSLSRTVLINPGADHTRGSLGTLPTRRRSFVPLDQVCRDHRPPAQRSRAGRAARAMRAAHAQRADQTGPKKCSSLQVTRPTFASRTNRAFIALRYKTRPIRLGTAIKSPRVN